MLLSGCAHPPPACLPLLNPDGRDIEIRDGIGWTTPYITTPADDAGAPLATSAPSVSGAATLPLHAAPVDGTGALAARSGAATDAELSGRPFNLPMCPPMTNEERELVLEELVLALWQRDLHRALADHDAELADTAAIERYSNTLLQQQAARAKIHGPCLRDMGWAL